MYLDPEIDWYCCRIIAEVLQLRQKKKRKPPKLPQNCSNLMRLGCTWPKTKNGPCFGLRSSKSDSNGTLPTRKPPLFVVSAPQNGPSGLLEAATVCYATSKGLPMFNGDCCHSTKQPIGDESGHEQAGNSGTGLALSLCDCSKGISACFGMNWALTLNSESAM